MIQMKGKYNTANIMLKDISLLDEATKHQIQEFLNNPAFSNSYLAIMPDCHKGAGSCIGLTMTLNDYLIPNVTGVDIGCGVSSVNIGKGNYNLKAFDEFVKNEIPSGFNVRKRNVEVPTLQGYIESISSRIESDVHRNMHSMGTLGGGNHFVELGIDSAGDHWLTVHTGSRKFGLDIANYHQKQAKEWNEVFLSTSEKNLEFIPRKLESPWNRYCEDMSISQRYAVSNRNIILHDLLKFFGIDHPLTHVNSTHNYIDFDAGIIRKGAISAQLYEQVIIPFNMEDGLIIGKGKGNKKWNYSAPHGAGRIFSRTKAKAQLDLTKAKDDMKAAGVYTSSLTDNSLDEAKGAYKDKDMILQAIEETIDITHYVRPIYNFKAC